ncbi:hypothetical protein AB6A23_11200 [Paenibacillus tarimensis]
MMNLILFMKPIVDMLWQYKILLLALIGGVVLYMLPQYCKVRISFTNSLLVFFSIMLTISFFNKIDENTSSTYLKVISAFMLFFAAQLNQDINKTLKVIAASYIIPSVYSLLLYLTDNGYVFWGGIRTFVGPYYYKTDLAIAVILSVIFFRKALYSSKSGFLKIIAGMYILVIAPMLILTANSRMMTIIYGVIIIYIIVERLALSAKRLTNLIKFSKVKKIAVVLLSCIVLVGGYFVYDSLTQNALKINLSSDEFFSQSNTQGRSGIWSTIIDNFLAGDTRSIMFGYYIGKDFEFNTYMGNDAHNSFLKLLVATGFYGLSLYVLFLLLIIYKIRAISKLTDLDNTQRFAVNTIIMVLLFFLISGMTQSNIIFTQSSWYAFYFMGLLYSPNLVQLSKTQSIQVGYNLASPINQLTTVPKSSYHRSL